MLIVAIAGGSGSGKTSVANQLCTALSEIEFSCTNLCEDSYYYSLNEAQLENVSAYNFDHPDAINHAQLMAHLDLLKQGLAIEAPTYCYKTHQQLDSTITMTPADVFVLEGLHLLHREHLLPFYDHTIFVDTPTQVRLDRRINRDVKERQRTIESVTQQFYQTVEPSHAEFIQPSKVNAHTVVDGTQPLDDFMPDIIQTVLNKLSR